MKRNLLTAAALATAGAMAGSTDAATITFVDATAANTSGATLTASAGGAGSAWKIRTGLGNDSGVVAVTSNASAATAPELTTTITGLVDGQEYNIFGYFWSIADGVSTADWDIEFGLTSGSLTTYDAGSVSLSNVTNLSSTPLDTTTPADEFDATSFTTSVLVSEGNRRLIQVALGTATADVNGEIAVYIDDSAGDNNRSWYDGVGYEVVPEPGSLALLGLGGLCVLRRRRD